MRGEKTHSVRALQRVYRTGSDEVRALRGVDLDLCSGEIVALLGPSGSGKSTLLNLLGGLDRPDAGEIRFRDDELTRFDDRALARYRRRHVGFVFQAYNLIPSLTARENVELACDGAGRAIGAADALGLVGLSARMDHFPGQLSGGEQQRAAVARAIAKRPELLLCDEPTGAVDRQAGVQLLEVIERCSLELGAATVLVTHNSAIAAMADRVLCLADGRIAEARRNTPRRKAAELSW
ncbi:MAG TPA: ABC transporter ATP-binding protein [Burkholderiales bacterium]|nr:ABC transporter ATP-binding protein [Burkholderiales bacterium]